MKKVMIFGILFITFINTVSASTGTVVCTGGDTSPLNVRDSIGGTTIGGLACNTEVEILNNNAGSGSGCSIWYQVKKDNLIGYSCGDYIHINNTNNDNNDNNDNNTNIKISTTSDNIYDKNNYKDKIDADGTIACYEDTGSLPLKGSVGGISTGKTVNCGDKVTINSVVESSGTCGYYYNITNSNGNSGYVCGYFVNTTKLSPLALSYYNEQESLEEYYDYLRGLNFPDSYLPYLAEIHARHPNWVFNAEIINLDFDDVVENESAYGRNLLQGAAFSPNYYSMDLNTYNILANTFYEYSTEKGWYNASTEAIAFFLDPRNYLNEKYIFAFESLGYNNEHDENTISKILSNQTFWTPIYNESKSSVSRDIISATSEIGISSVHIASRIKQEISGISITDPRLGGEFVSGDTTYSGYYNFFNIGVYGTNKIVNGMVYAMNNGWNTPFNAIYGGSSFIYNDYVSVNQDTMYYEKFDVSTSNGHYTHQYMQNLAAAIQETDTAYKSYVELEDYLSKNIIFTIPVYQNMSSYVVTSPSVGNPNNYLNDLTIDGETISGFTYNNYIYDISVPYEKESIEINASKISSSASIKGLGKINNDSDNKTVEIIVAAETGRTRTYTINITRLEKAPDIEVIVPDISTIMNNSGVKYNDNYVFGINENTSIKGLINNIKEIGTYASVTVKDSNGNNKEDDIFKTGDVITITNTKETKEYKVLIYGDVNGDGKIDKDDCLNVLRQINGYANLEDVYKASADANKDGKIDKDDCLAVLRHINNYTNLNE